MGQLVKGKWEESPLAPHDNQGRFVRSQPVFHQWVTADGSSHFKAEPNRYHLYISYACPWACRTLMMRALKGLETVVSFTPVEPLMLEGGWRFGEKGSDTYDHVNYAKFLAEIYVKAKTDYTGRVSVPVLWDKQQQTIVNNESAEIIRMLNAEFNDYAQNKVDYYPADFRKAIDEINTFVYEHINNGVYKCGFAQSQQAYDEAFDELFSALDQIENCLSTQQYLVGDQLTEADIRLFTTLIRFDVVYFSHFKCNKKRIMDYPHLWRYTKTLYQIPEVKETVNFDHIKQHYYGSMKSINPTGIVPKGPDLAL